ncbi:hypothetical protein N0V93_007342 [Gnomoniopsis smithogilvyi]|uniref:Fe2OG dioxygenase domain-containing protein n=1 Tax=Gnomoniopsis smithogilvyi TaxID=1191159 RepID=A0A9W9CWI2_9PEZI|nr:hypothetical protein N0V93_007342 [Gnomoniopsis smithogilvyi]
MAAVTKADSSTDTYKLELRSAYGPVYRDVLKTPPRDCDPSEVPVIDLSGIYGDLAARKALAATIRDAAEKTGFFYIKNHGIPGAIIDAALAQAKAFFAQPVEKKASISTSRSAFFNGWTEIRGTNISPSETRDFREGFAWRYDPIYDPDPKDHVPEEIKPWIRGEEFVWDGTSHLPGFKEDCLKYWQECLKLARRIIRIFALALDLPETYFDEIVTFPGADGVFNYYPANDAPPDTTIDVGLGAHTDLQSFTLLLQDSVGGLQVLTNEGQWIKVPPIKDTFVINIGDFLMRLSNDRFQSTVHRVFNIAPVDRYSMPFFFGFNFNEKCGVLPSCTSESNPPKYEPITCGEWCQLRFEQGSKKKT